MKKHALFLVFLTSCGGDKDSFPSTTQDLCYPNGHPLALNEIDLADKEAELLAITNSTRVALGLKPVSPSSILAAMARAHSAHMISHHFYGHMNPEGDGPGERLEKVVPGNKIGLWENVWLTTSTDMQVVFDAFWNSPGHRAALLSDSDQLGIGLWMDRTTGANVIYVTMEFAKLY